MRYRQTALEVMILLAVFFAFSPAPVMAGEPAQTGTPIASLRIGPASVDWLPHVDYGRLVLTVAGPGGLYVEREFGSGELPSFSSHDIQDGHLPDGVYAYELRAVSRQDQELREKLAKARETGGDSALSELQKGARLPEKPLVQSGHLWVQGGGFVDRVPAQRVPPTQSKPASKTPLNNFPLKDIVDADDLVVQGRACIGPVCAAVGSTDPLLTLKGDFGDLFQIKFENTACCHPTARDWAIQVDDSVEVTGDFLIRTLDFTPKIPFRIAADAPDNAFTVFPFSGNIGLGTLTPAVRLDVKTNDAGKATERLQNSSATGYSGAEYLNNTGTVSLFFGVDNAAATTRLNSVNNNPIVILTNSTERMRVTSGGNLGIGTASPTDKLHLFENVNVNTLLTIENPNTGLSAAGVLRTKSDSATMNFQSHGSGRTISRFGQSLASWGEFLQVTGNGLIIGTLADKPLILGTNSANRLHITSGGNVGIGTASPTHPLEMASGANVTTGGVWTNASSRELKRDIHSLGTEEALSALAGLEPVRFRYKADPDDEWLGFIAEEVPDLVATADRKTLSPMDLTAVLTKVVQEQQKAIVDLRATVASLSEKLTEMEGRKENNQ